MSRAAGYFRLQLKRFFKLMPVILLLSALLLGIVGMAFVGLFAESESDEQKSLVNIGIVGDSEDSYLGMALTALQNDTSRFSLAIRTMEEESAAAEMLRRGELVAYLVLPDDFIGEAIRGNVHKITCVTSSGASDFGTRITSELMRTVTEMVAYSQKAVFGFQRAAQDYGLPDSQVWSMGDEVALEVIDLIIEREAAYQVEEIGDSGMKTVRDPLACGMIVLMLMLWGITCCTIFAARNGTLFRVLSSKGTGPSVQVLAEYGAYFVFMTAALSVLVGAVFIVLRFTPPMPLLEKYDFNRLIPGLIVPALTISAMQFFLYEAAGGVVSGALLQFFCAMGVGYISGCIYPAYYFPRAVQNAASFLPAWSCRLWLDELIADRLSLSTFAVLTAYFAGFLILAVLLRRTRIRRGGGGV